MIVARDDRCDQAHAALEHVHDKAARTGRGTFLGAAVTEVAPRPLQVAGRRLPELREQVGVQEFLRGERRKHRIGVPLAQQREPVEVEIRPLAPAQEFARAVYVAGGNCGGRLRHRAELAVEVLEE